MVAVRDHLHHCAGCRDLLDELKVVDALLFTAKPVALPENFTFAVMAETRSMPAPRAHQSRVWSFLALYLAAAWMAAAASLTITGTSPAAAFAALGTAMARAGTRADRVAAALSGSIGHTVPSLAALGIGVFGLDILLAAAAALLYIFIRPRVAARLATIREAS